MGKSSHTHTHTHKIEMNSWGGMKDERSVWGGGEVIGDPISYLRLYHNLLESEEMGRRGGEKEIISRFD